MKKRIIAIITAMSFLCFSCAETSSKIRLRPDLTKNDSEIWEVSGKGNSWAEWEDLDDEVKYTAAKKSSSEGYDCFFLRKSGSDISIREYTFNTTKTMHGQVNTNVHGNSSSNYYSQSGRYLGSSTGDINAYGHSDYSYEVPVTETRRSATLYKDLYVEFLHEEQCQEIELTKWRDRVYYNESEIERIKDKRFKKTAIEIVAWGGLAVLTIISFIVIANEMEKENQDGY